MLIIWFFQAAICFYCVIGTPIAFEDVIQQQLSVEFGVTRIVTMIIMHMLMTDEFDQALNMMKYALNHPWKFHNYKYAFLVGVFQLSISIIIEVSNVWVVIANS